MARRDAWLLCAILPSMACGRTQLDDGLSVRAGGVPALGGTRATGGVIASGGTASTWTNNTGGLVVAGGTPSVGGARSSSQTPITGGSKSVGGTAATAGTGATGGAGITGTGGAGTTSGIRVVTATYGPICGVARGNVTAPVAQKCDGVESTCQVFVNYAVFGDPAYLCAKDFEVTWVCGADPTERTAYHDAAANESYAVSIGCQEPPTGGTEGPASRADAGATSGIHVVTATYGPTCGTARSNVTAPVAQECNGIESTCNILVGKSVFGDPASGCANDFEVIWACGADPTERRTYHGSVGAGDYVFSIGCQQSPTGGTRDAGGPTGPGATSGIHVVTATYGPICGSAQGNVTVPVAQRCNGVESTCTIHVDNNAFGDPAYRCMKDFEVFWVCGADPTERRAYHDAVGDESYDVSISCGQLPARETI